MARRVPGTSVITILTVIYSTAAMSTHLWWGIFNADVWEAALPKLSENACEEIISWSLGGYCLLLSRILKSFLFERCNFKRLLCGGSGEGEQGEKMREGG